MIYRASFRIFDFIKGANEIIAESRGDEDSCEVFCTGYFISKGYYGAFN